MNMEYPHYLQGLIDIRDKEIKRLEEWISDLHSNKYINCVYCGHRYGPDTVPPSREILHEHITKCEKHPLCEALQLLKEQKAAVKKFLEAEGHDLCHENRCELAEAFGLEDLAPRLVTRDEFVAGCKRYQDKIYGLKTPPDGLL